MTQFIDRYRSYAKPEELYATRNADRTWSDGWPHERDEKGWCRNCAAPPGMHHARLVRKENT